MKIQVDIIWQHVRIWLNEISPPAQYSWACQRESGQDNVGALSSSSSPAASSRVSRRTGRNTDLSPDPNFPGPSSLVDCGLEGKKDFIERSDSNVWAAYDSYRWESCRCSGNTCCCGSIGTPCTDQSLSALCARLHLRKMNKITREWYHYLTCSFKNYNRGFRKKKASLIPIRMLSGLMSLWMNPILWTLSTAQTNSEM